jgi:hypothetical protein
MPSLGKSLDYRTPLKVGVVNLKKEDFNASLCRGHQENYI